MNISLIITNSALGAAQLLFYLAGSLFFIIAGLFVIKIFRED